MKQRSTADPAVKPVAVIIVLGFASLCASLTQTIILPIQPALPGLLGTTPSNASWVVTVTLLGGGVAMPVAGRLADIRGRKPVLVGSALLLLAGSVVCAVSSSLVPVVIGRLLQGFAMGYIPVAISFVREIVPVRMQNSAVAGISATLGVGGALGLPLAAWIAEDFSWNALFWIISGLAAVMAVSSAVVLPDNPPIRRAPLDLVGAVGVAVGVATLLVGVSKGNDWGWTAPSTLGAIAGGVAVLVLWGVYETRHDDPLVDLRATVRRPVLLTNIAALLAGFGMMAQSIVVPQLLQMPEATGFGHGQTMLAAGLWMAPAGLMMLAFSPVSSRLLTRFGGRTTLAIGTAVLASGYLIAVVLMSAPWQLMLATCVASAGIGIAYAALPTLIMDNSPPEDAGAGVGVNALMRSMGTTTAGAVMAIVLTGLTASSGGGDGGAAVPTETAFRLCFLIGAAATLVATAVTLLIRRAPVPAAASVGGAGAPGPQERGDEEQRQDAADDREDLETAGGHHQRGRGAAARTGECDEDVDGALGAGSVLRDGGVDDERGAGDEAEVPAQSQ